MITNANRTNADGCAGINQVADLQRKETADISDNLIYGNSISAVFPCCTVFPFISRWNDN